MGSQFIITLRLCEKGYLYDISYLPHDGAITDYTREDNKTREEVLQDLGFKTAIVPRIPDINEGIHMTRMAFGNCWFDESKCGTGLVYLEAYRKEFNPKTQCYRDRPLHNDASNSADAFRQFAQGFSSRPKTKRRVRKVSAMAV